MATEREVDAYAKGYEAGSQDSALLMTQRLDAALKLVYPEHITPMGVRVITQAFHGGQGMTPEQSQC